MRDLITRGHQEEVNQQVFTLRLETRTGAGASFHEDTRFLSLIDDSQNNHISVLVSGGSPDTSENQTCQDPLYHLEELTAGRLSQQPAGTVFG